jgi:hypothetical protein
MWKTKNNSWLNEMFWLKIKNEAFSSSKLFNWEKTHLCITLLILTHFGCWSTVF